MKKDPTIAVHNNAVLMAQLIEGIKQAEGASSQLIHLLNDPRFIVIREALFCTRDAVARLATFQTKMCIFKGED